MNITGGGVHADANWNGGNATINFWRDAENLTTSPSSGNTVWATSQATPMRGLDINGSMALSLNGYSSGGFISDSVVTGQVDSGTQQQYIMRNDQIGSWTGKNWNMVFVGSTGVPGNTFPNPPYTTVATTPTISEKPYLYVDGSGNWNVFVPGNQSNRSGTSWSGGSTPGSSLPISDFYLAQPGDSANTINAQLAAGKDLILTPGIYNNLGGTINVNNPDTVVLGLGMATLESSNGQPAISVADVNGVRIGGLIIDAGSTNSSVLMQVGPSGSSASHASRPDGAVGRVLPHRRRVRRPLDADAGNQQRQRDRRQPVAVARRPRQRGHHRLDDQHRSNGLVVNGANVTMYGLAVEHYQQTQTQWNGANGARLLLPKRDAVRRAEPGSWMNGERAATPRSTSPVPPPTGRATA